MTPRSAQPPAFILTIGDELLVGDRADLNGPWLARRLSELGFAVRELRSVGDELAELMGALAEAEARATHGVVVVTGGLGPTLDDRTRDALSALRGVPLDLDPEIMAALEVRARARGLAHLAETNRRIALVPRGARRLPNPVGTAPGLELSIAGGPGVLVVLPGVPREMRAIFDETVALRLVEMFGARLTPPEAQSIETSGIVESQLAQELEAVLPETNGIRIAYRPSLEGVEVRISIEASEVPDDLAPTQVLARALEVAAPVLAPWRIDGGERAADGLAGAVLRALLNRGLHIATAESCTGGLISERLTSVSGSSGAVRGAVVAYSNDVKIHTLGVENRLLEVHGAVSEPVAAAMAEGVARALGADVAVAVTGVAGPSGGTPEKPVGTVCFGFRRPDGTVVTERKFFPGGRGEVRIRASAHALFRVLRLVEGEASAPFSA